MPRKQGFSDSVLWTKVYDAPSDAPHIIVPPTASDVMPSAAPWVLFDGPPRPAPPLPPPPPDARYPVQPAPDTLTDLCLLDPTYETHLQVHGSIMDLYDTLIRDDDRQLCGKMSIDGTGIILYRAPTTAAGWKVLNNRDELLEYKTALWYARPEFGTQGPHPIHAQVERHGLRLSWRNPSTRRTGAHAQAVAMDAVDEVYRRAESLEGARTMIRDDASGAIPVLRRLTRCMRDGTIDGAHASTTAVAQLASHCDPGVTEAVCALPYINCSTCITLTVFDNAMHGGAASGARPREGAACSMCSAEGTRGHRTCRCRPTSCEWTGIQSPTCIGCTGRHSRSCRGLPQVGRVR